MVEHWLHFTAVMLKLKRLMWASTGSVTRKSRRNPKTQAAVGGGPAPSCASFFLSCSLRHHCPPHCVFLCANLIVLAVTFLCLHSCGCKCKDILSKEKIPSCFSSHVHTTFFLHKMIHLQRGSDIQSHSSYMPVISHHSGGAEEPITLW